MKKIALSLLAGLVVTACNSDPLKDIKSGKVGESSSLTWGQAAEKFTYCEDETRHWALVNEQREDRKVATFTCSLNDKSIEPYNEKLRKKNPSQPKPKEVTSIEYMLTVNHWLDDKRQKYQGEFEGSEEIILTFKNGETKRELNPDAKYIIKDINPTDMIW